MKKKSISSLDWLVFIIVAMYLVDMDFEKMSTVNWIGSIAALAWLILFIIKHTLPTKRGGN